MAYMKLEYVLNLNRKYYFYKSYCVHSLIHSFMSCLCSSGFENQQLMQDIEKEDKLLSGMYSAVLAKNSYRPDADVC